MRNKCKSRKRKGKRHRNFMWRGRFRLRSPPLATVRNFEVPVPLLGHYVPYVGYMIWISKSIHSGTFSFDITATKRSHSNLFVCNHLHSLQNISDFFEVDFPLGLGSTSHAVSLYNGYQLSHISSSSHISYQTSRSFRRNCISGPWPGAWISGSLSTSFVSPTATSS
jgi:hypothetical protein